MNLRCPDNPAEIKHAADCYDPECKGECIPAARCENTEDMFEEKENE